MSNPFYYLAGLLLVLEYPMGREPLWFADVQITPWAVLGLMAIYGVLCWAVLSRPLHRPPLARFILRLVGMVFYIGIVFLFHFPLWIWGLGVEEDPMASTLLALTPLIALYGILALVHARTDPDSGGLRFAFRGFFGLSLLPILLMLTLNEAFERVDALRRLAFVYPAAGWMVGLGSLALLMVFLPVLLRIILGARRLEPGPLRDRLERMCDTAGFRAGELWVVPTGSSRMANAFVVGLSAGWRYVFFTEAILQGMPADELECVLVHEITHSQKRHILSYLVAALAFSLLSGLGHEALDAARVPGEAIIAALLVWLVLYWGVLFGFVSRRFETEADLVAARMVPPVEGGLPPYGGSRRMAAALERVAMLNHVPIWAWSWRHFTIERRMDILVRAELDPSVGERFERTCDRLRRCAIGLLLSGLLCGGILIGLEHGRAPENRELLRAFEAVDRGRRALKEKRYEEARDHLKFGIEGGAATVEARLRLAECERALGRDEEARREEAIALKLGVTDPRDLLRLRR